MLYLGHFYFDGQDSEGKECCGHFTCLAEAGKVENAVKKFVDHICELRDSSELFNGAVSIYLDDIVEIQKIPDKAISLDFISSSGEDSNPVGIPITSERSDYCAVYDWLPEGVGEDEEYEDEPILRFESKQPSQMRIRKRRHLRLIK
jgi:hypothetical protein